MLSLRATEQVKESIVTLRYVASSLIKAKHATHQTWVQGVSLGMASTRAIRVVYKRRMTMLHDEFTVWPKPVQDHMRKHAQVTYRKLSTAPDANYRDPAK
jgi:hypothetical protein